MREIWCITSPISWTWTLSAWGTGAFRASKEISGIVRGLLLRQLRGGGAPDILLLEKLRRSGVDGAFIKLLEGEVQ